MVVKQGKVYKYRLYKTYKKRRRVLVYQTDSIVKARDKYDELTEKGRTIPISIVDKRGKDIKYLFKK